MKTATANRLPAHRKGYLRKRLAESWQWYLLLLPGLIYLIIFLYGPMYGVQIAFRDTAPRRASPVPNGLA